MRLRTLFMLTAMGVVAALALGASNAGQPDDGKDKRDINLLAEALRNRIDGDKEFKGKFTQEEIDKLLKILRSGPLEPPLKAKPATAITVEELRGILVDYGPPKREALHVAAQRVRGDSGKWNEDAGLFHVPLLDVKKSKGALDAWADQHAKKKPALTDKDDHWLIYRSEQIDDNDRIWVERAEREGKQITVRASKAKWLGKYFRNFTYYQVVAVNLGKLQAGDYEAKWIFQPLVFTKFDGDGKALDANWPKDERPADKKPTELRLTFSVGKS